MQHKRIKNPNWQEATSWLFTIVAEDLNSELLWKNPAIGQSVGTQPAGPPDCESNELTTRPRCLRIGHYREYPPPPPLGVWLIAGCPIWFEQVSYYGAIAYLNDWVNLHSFTVKLQMYSGDMSDRSSRVKGRFSFSAGDSTHAHVHRGNTSWQVIPEQPVAPVLSGE